MRSLLVDVDGVVADLVGGMRRFTSETYGVDFDPTQIVYHNRMGRSPGMAEAHRALLRWFPDDGGEYVGFGGAFQCYMRSNDVYARWVDPIPGSIDAIAELRERFDIAFVTALMRSARDHFRSKMEWIERWFPGIPILTAPSGQKWRVHGNYAIDDRYDTCERWWANGVSAVVFRQPWNEIPVGLMGIDTYDWSDLREVLK